jgi:hypothetical protein
MRSPDGKAHDKVAMQEYQRVNAATTKKVYAYTASIESMSLLPSGDVVAIALQKYDREQAPADKPDQLHRVQTSAVQREVWHRTNGLWLIRTIEEILLGPVVVDGKIGPN